MNAQALLSAAEAGATILTSNQRTQRWLHRLYDAQQQLQRAAWPTPAILSWSAWLESLWQEYVLQAGRRSLMRLNAAQERALWEGIIRDSDAGRELLAVDTAAELACEAWRLLQEYCVADFAALGATQDGSAFQSWAQTFAERCAAKRWIDSASLTELLCEAVAQRRLPVSGRLILVGFDKLTPRQEQFIATLRDCGCSCEVEHWPQAEPPQNISRICVADRTAEMRHAAEWARRCLLESASDSGEARSGPQVSAHIGIVIPDLENVRERVERMFTEAISPQSLLNAGEGAPGFEISLGRPLARYPIIHTALELLRWTAGSLPIARAGALLRSVYLRGGRIASDHARDADSEASRRALLDAVLCGEGAPDVSVEDVSRRASERRAGGGSYPHSCAVLAGRLQAVSRQFRIFAQPPSAWSQNFSTVLQIFGWPGDRTLNSADHQACESWFELLKAFGTLDCVHPLLSHTEALTVVGRLAARTVFQPENLGAPVQVLGPLEASGSRFDCLWVMAADDERWLAPAHPNPLLPLALQKRYGMPHAFPADDLAFAQQVTERLCQSARQIVFSYARAEGDRSLRPSPLLADVPERAAEEILPNGPSSWVGAIAACAPDCAAWQDNAPLRLNSLADGGVKVFQLQAACPFRAFAELRLRATALAEPAPGLSAQARGTLVHAVLQRVWERLQDASRLRELSPEAQRNLIVLCVEDALRKNNIVARDEWFGRFARLEQERLTGLVSAWLDYEKQRAPFRVLASEQTGTLTLGGLSVIVRVDRVDELLDAGGRVILDYKTGGLSTNLESAWDDARPEEPQLPLYAVASREFPAAVAFAHVRAGDLRFRGDTDLPGVLPGVKALSDERLQEKIERWRSALTALAQQFLAGQAEVNPKNEESCRYCALPPLCRIGQSPLGVPSVTEADSAVREAHDE